VAVETFGAFGQEAWDFNTELGRRLMATIKDTRAAFFLFQRLSAAAAVQRGNAVCILGTVDDKSSSAEYRLLFFCFFFVFFD
jgi:hypothetical protein